MEKVWITCQTIKCNTDVLMICETKIDDSFPLGNFLPDGFSSTFRVDRDWHGGGTLLFIPTIFHKRRYLIEDTHREKVLSNKTPPLRKSTNMSVWAVGILNQLFIRGS